MNLAELQVLVNVRPAGEGYCDISCFLSLTVYGVFYSGFGSILYVLIFLFQDYVHQVVCTSGYNLAFETKHLVKFFLITFQDVLSEYEVLFVSH